MNIHPVFQYNPIILKNYQTIKKQLVDRTAINEVFITNIKQLSNNSYLIAAQLPRIHMHFNDVQNGYYIDVRFSLEKLRNKILNSSNLLKIYPGIKELI